MQSLQKKKTEQSIQMQLLATQSIPIQSDEQAVKLRADELCPTVISYASNANVLIIQVYNP